MACLISSIIRLITVTYGAAYVPILLRKVEQERRPSGNGDREAIEVGVGLCDGEVEHAHIEYVPKIKITIRVVSIPFKNLVCRPED